MIARLRGNGTHAKAVFACSAQGFWREYDLPAQLERHATSGQSPLSISSLWPNCWEPSPASASCWSIAIAPACSICASANSPNAKDFFILFPAAAAGDGFAGYDGGHAERRVADEARQHFKLVAEVLKNALGQGMF
jgi:hypothetical protein